MQRIGRVAALATVLFAAYAVVMVGGWASARTVAVVDAAASVVVPLFATVFAARSASTAQRGLRSAWTALALGLASATVAEVLWALYKFTGGKAPFPSVADAAYLLFPVGVLAALLLFPGGSRQSQSRLLLDGVIMAASLLLVSWLTVMQPMYEQAGKTPLETMVSLAYPVSNVAALTVAAMALARAVQPPMTMIAVGLACMTSAEIAYAYISGTGFVATHHLVNVGWMAGMVLIMIAASQGARALSDAPRRTTVPGWASTLLPYAPLMLAGAVLAIEQPAHVRSPLVVSTGVVLGLAVLVRQLLAVAENQRLLATVSDRAMHDPLTGLANRVLFADRLEHALQLRQRDGRSTGLLALDLNDFKLVNDTMGHLAGDELLTSCADRLRGSVRTGDTVARLGGDEFAVLLEGRTEQWIPVAERVVAAFERPFVVDGHELLIRPSAGLAVAGPADPADMSAEELLKRADLAMYSAKRSHGRGVFTFSPEMAAGDSRETDAPARSQALQGAAIVQVLGELRQAIERSELALVYQPKFAAVTRDVVGVEALLRWPHPERGLLGPEGFLPLVREHGLMGAITDLVIATALDDAARWWARGVDVPVAVNLFAPLLDDLGLPRRVGAALAERGLPASALTVEITEDLFLTDIPRTRTVLAQLRERGVRIAIDDFGSGYSALSYLSDLPIDEVKLDHDFVAPAMNDLRAATVVGSVIDLAHRLGLVAVAEGVESAEMAARITEFGCDMLQGYYLSAPLKVDELIGLLGSGR